MAINLDVFKQQLIEVKYIFNSKTHDYSDDLLSQKLWIYYLKKSQKYRVFDQKVKLKNSLIKIIYDYFSENGVKFVELFISGSTANGFATIDSDIDLCFIVSNFYDLDLVKSKKLHILRSIQQILIENGFHLNESQVIDARVPILRFIDQKFKIQVEINVNNEIGIRNTRLLYCYSKR
jgi:poly(A) RNA polymerase GLD2